MASGTENRYVNLYVNGQQITSSYNTMRKDAAKLRAELNAGKLTQAEYNQKVKELGVLNTKMKAHRDALRGTASQWSKMRGLAAGIFGGSLLIGAFTAFKNAISGAIQTVKDFNVANSKLNAVLNLTKEETAALRVQQQELGSSTAFTASQAADAQTELAKLGFTLREITNLTPAVLDLAAAAGTDLATAATIAGSTLRQFDLDASEAQRVVDVMAKSFSISALDIDKFNVAMRVAGPVAKNAGLTIEETTGQLALLIDRGIRAESAGTALRNIFLRLAKEGKSFEQAMLDLNNATDKNKAAVEAFGTEAAVQAIILAENAEAADDLTLALEGSAGAAAKMAETKLDNLTGDVTRLTSAWEGFVLSIEDGEGVFSRFSRSVVQGLTDMFDTIKDTNRISGQLSEAIGLEYWSDGFIRPGLYNEMADLQESINVWGDSAREAFAKGNIEGGMADITYLEELREEYAGNEMALKLINTEMLKLKETRNEAVLGGLVSGVTKAVGDGPTKKGTPSLTDEEQKAAEKAEKAAEKEAKALQDKYDKLLEVIKAEEEKLALARLEGREKEEAEVNSHHDKQIAEAQGKAEAIAGIEANRTEALLQIDEKYAKEKEAIRAEIDAALLGQDVTTHPEIIALQQLWDEKIRIAEEAGYKVEETKAASAEAQKALADDLAQAESEAALRAWQQKMQLAQSMVSSVTQGFSEISAANSTANLNQLKADQSAAVNKAKIAGKSTAEIAEIEEGFRQKIAKENARALKQRQKMALIEMGINAAISVANAIKSASSMPYPANLIAIPTAVAAVLGFIAKAKSAFSSEEVPEYATGTVNANGSYVAGEAGREIIEGDRVIPADITQKILANNAFNTAGPQPNFSLINDGLTYSQSQQVAQGSVSTTAGGGDMSALINETRALHSAILSMGERPVVFVDNDYQQFKKDKASAESNVVIQNSAKIIRGAVLVN